MKFPGKAPEFHRVGERYRRSLPTETLPQGPRDAAPRWRVTLPQPHAPFAW